MKANNLSISIQNYGCQKNCPYCVSKMTGSIDHDLKLFKKNLVKARTFSLLSNVSSISITSKGEPLLYVPGIDDVLEWFVDFPVELQTNGLFFLKNMSLINYLSDKGIDVFAFSLDKICDFEKLQPVFKRVKLLNKIIRVTLNVTNMLPDSDEEPFWSYVAFCRQSGVDQLSLRRITEANHTDLNDIHYWIRENVTKFSLYDELIEQFKESPYSRKIRTLSYGAELYDIDGLSFTYFDYCIQDESNSENIRSLIYMEDGHMYTSWNSKASRIF